MNAIAVPAGLEALIEGSRPSGTGKIYRIGELAQEFGVTLRTLRFYEDKGLVNPARSGSTRLYSEDDRSRLQMILLAKRIGFSLAEIQNLFAVQELGSPSKEALKRLLAKFKGQVTVLQQQRVDVERALEDLRETIAYLDSKV